MFTLEFDEQTLATMELILNGTFIEHIEAVLQRFYQQAGGIIKYFIQQQLGHDDLYHLDPEYAKRKLENPFMYRVAGKDADQPLILSGTLYNSFTVTVSQNSVSVGIQPSLIASRRALGFQFRRQATGLSDNAREIRRSIASRRKITPINATYVAEYAQKWEDRTHFMEKALRQAEPVLVELLGEYISNAIEGLVWGGWSGNSSGYVSLSAISQGIGRESSRESAPMPGMISREIFSPISNRGGFDPGLQME
jgi:hypothetical protein